MIRLPPSRRDCVSGCARKPASFSRQLRRGAEAAMVPRSGIRVSRRQRPRQRLRRACGATRSEFASRARDAGMIEHRRVLEGGRQEAAEAEHGVAGAVVDLEQPVGARHFQDHGHLRRQRGQLDVAVALDHVGQAAAAAFPRRRRQSASPANSRRRSAAGLNSGSVRFPGKTPAPVSGSGVPECVSPRRAYWSPYLLATAKFAENEEASEEASNSAGVLMAAEGVLTAAGNSPAARDATSRTIRGKFAPAGTRPATRRSPGPAATRVASGCPSTWGRRSRPRHCAAGAAAGCRRQRHARCRDPDPM